MNCNCNSPQLITSWIDWQHAAPQDPLDLIANATFNGQQGAFVNTANFMGSTPITNSFAIAQPITCQALETDNLQMVADSVQWQFSHQPQNLAATLALPLTKVIFLRGGPQWQMT